MSLYYAAFNRTYEELKWQRQLSIKKNTGLLIVPMRN